MSRRMPNLARNMLLAPFLGVLWLASFAWAIAGLLHAAVHLFAARLLGIEVQTASLGVGPALVKGEQLQLAMLPGAFVRPALSKVPLWKVGAYLAVGPLGSLVTAWLVLLLGFAVEGVRGVEVEVSLPDEVRVVGEVFPNTPAEAAGFRPGDEIESINDADVRGWSDVVAAVGAETLQVRVRRRGQPMDLVVTPRPVEDRYVMGIARPPGPVERRVYGLGEAASRSTEVVTRTFEVVANLFVGRLTPTGLGGPVAVFGAAQGRGTGSPWAIALASMVAMRGLALFAYNLLPLPYSDVLTGLDEASQRLRGRPLPMKVLNVAGGAMLLALFIVLLAADAMRFVSGGVL